MLKIPSQILLLYEELLVKRAVPERPRFLYKKWLRYYLDSCHEFRFEASKRENLSGFLNKLKDKKQNKDQTEASRSCNINYLVPERKLGFFVQIKEGENFNHRNTLSISRIKI